MHIHMFDGRLLALMDEIHNHHPHIIAICSAQADKDFYMQLCEVAAAIGVVVEGDFNDKQTYELCEFLTKQLVKSRTIMVLPDSSLNIEG